MLNVVVLEGRLVDNPVERKSAENSYHGFTLAHDTGIKDGENTIAEFFDCNTINSKAITYCHKGDRIAITGVLKNRVFTRKDGTKGHQYEILVNRIDFIDVKKVEETKPVEEAK